MDLLYVGNGGKYDIDHKVLHLDAETCTRIIIKSLSMNPKPYVIKFWSAKLEFL